MHVRRGTAADAAAIVRIYNQGIAERLATFETRPRVPEDLTPWFERPYPLLVVEREGKLIAFAVSLPNSERACYAGIAEFSVYVAREHREQGAGRSALEALIEACRQAGFWKLIGKVFPENVASLRLLASLGFREVGVHKAHARLDGRWRDVVLVECLLRD